MLNFISAASVAAGDFVGFTFFIGSVSMLAATVWFLMQHGVVDSKFKDSMLVAALITGIAAVHYFYMREQWTGNYADLKAAQDALSSAAAGADTTALVDAVAQEFKVSSPVVLRYIDWILTVPLMVVEFALLTGVGMRKLFWASTVMLVAGYFGESNVTGMLDAQTWGAISGVAYFWMAYEVGCLSIFGGPSGSVGKALASASGKIPSAGRMLQWFVLVGWAIYPIGYMAGTPGWYEGMFAFLDEGSMNLIYNVGDAVNKIGFGMAVWYAAKS